MLSQCCSMLLYEGRINCNANERSIKLFYVWNKGSLHFLHFTTFNRPFYSQYFV